MCRLLLNCWQRRFVHKWPDYFCSNTSVQKFTHLDACSILRDVTKCFFFKSKPKPARCNFRVGICVWVIFSVRMRTTVDVSLRRRVKAFIVRISS